MKTIKGIVLFTIVFLGLSFINSANSFADSAQDIYNRVASLEKSGDYAEAAKLAKDMIKAGPGNDFYLAYASHVERMALEFDSGEKHALEAIGINPNVPWYYASAAFNAYGNGDFATAAKFCRKVIEYGPEQAGQGNIDTAKAILKNTANHEYEIHWKLDPSKGAQNNGICYFPLPTDKLPYQKVSFKITGAARLNIVKPDGNDIALFKPVKGKPVEMTVSASTKAYSFKPLMAKYTESDEIPDDVRVYLGKSEGINPDSPVLKKIAGDLKGRNKIETVKNILLWLKKNIRYQIEDFKEVEEIIDRGYGECGCWSALFTALCRSAGIPARGVWGVIEDPTPDRKFAPEGHLKGHAWAEFYLPGIGWIPVEPQSPETLGQLPSSYVRMYQYDIKSRHWSIENFRASDNMVVMGGDTPEFTQRNTDGKDF
ncbi:MAG: hypothetical protein LWY06_09255 [Firmicutes bacterium]|nr:hypothetical protein [Bacillota bacterium]